LQKLSRRAHAWNFLAYIWSNLLEVLDEMRSLYENKTPAAVVMGIEGAQTQ
jgi:hypothetical protein